jgi:hypothetical protein
VPNTRLHGPHLFVFKIFNVYLKLSHPSSEKEPTTITAEEGTLSPPSKANFIKIDKNFDFLIVVSSLCHCPNYTPAPHVLGYFETAIKIPISA